MFVIVVYQENMNKSAKLYQDACKVMPGGVNSPVRAYKYVGKTPAFFKEGKGAYIYDVDDKKYIDYVCAYGPMILGHAATTVCDAVNSVAIKGFHFGASHELEITLANKIISHMPVIEKIRLVSSGTEACMSAIRLARAYTNRPKIIKFAGCYHGHSDSLLVSAGSGAMSCGEPSSPGVLASQAQDTLIVNYNDIKAVRDIFILYPRDIAAVIVEPIAGNMGMVLPQPEFLNSLRSLCDEFAALLLFDEVMTGFRVALGGCSSIYGVQPDLTMLGKVIGGGFPIGAFGGGAEIMDYLAPNGPVYQAGTLSGSPVALAAGLATLTVVEQSGFYEDLAAKSTYLTRGISAVMQQGGIDFSTNCMGGMFGFAFTKNSPDSLPVFTLKQQKIFNQCFHSLRVNGINFAPSPFEAAFISAAHSFADIDDTISAFSYFTQLISCQV